MNEEELKRVVFNPATKEVLIQYMEGHIETYQLKDRPFMIERVPSEVREHAHQIGDTRYDRTFVVSEGVKIK